MKHYIQPTLTTNEYLYIAVLVRTDIARRLGMSTIVPVLEQFQLDLDAVAELCEKFAVGAGAIQAPEERNG